MQNFNSYPFFPCSYRLRSVWFFLFIYFCQTWTSDLWGQKNIIHGLDKQSDTIEVFTGDKYFDSGGPGGSKLPDQPGNYINCSDPFNESLNCTSLFTLCSNSDTVAVNFVAYQIVTGDRLRIFAGGTSKGKILFNSLTQGVSLNGMKLTTGTFIKSTEADGCLTFEWFCTTIGNSIGWEVDVIVQPKTTPNDTFCIPQCKPNVLISIPSDTCYKEIVLNEVLDSEPGNCAYDLILYYPFGTDKPDRDAVNSTHINSSFLYEVKSAGSSCFGYVHVEESLPPFAFCSTDTISCLDWEQNVITESNLSTCSGLKYTFKSIQFEALPCDQIFAGMIIRQIEIHSGVTSTCTDTLYLLKPSKDSLICPADLKISCDVIPGGIGPSALSPALLQSLLDKNGDNRLDSDPSGFLNPSWQGLTVNDSSAFCGLGMTYSDFIIPGCGNTYKIRRQWVIRFNCMETDTVCIQNILVEDVSGPGIPVISSLEFQVAPLDCKAAVAFDAFTDIQDCNAVVQRLELVYRDPLDPDKQIVINNFLPVKLSLPPGGYTAKFFFSDQCFNASRTDICILVMSNESPVASPLENATYFIGPETCWSRVYAKDLDSVSSDGCCSKLHFAIALEDSVNFYRQYWQNKITAQCDGEDQYTSHALFYDELIDRWITAFVFKDFLDLQPCENRRLLFRAFESCNLPDPDPAFSCGPHQWFCYLTIPEWRGWKNASGDADCLSRYELDCFSTLQSGLLALDDSFLYPEAGKLEDTMACSSAYTSQYLAHLVRNYDEQSIEVFIVDTLPPHFSELPDLMVYSDGIPSDPFEPCCLDSLCLTNPIPPGQWPGALTCNCDSTHFYSYYGGPLRPDAIYDSQGNYTYPFCQYYNNNLGIKPVYCPNYLFSDTLSSFVFNPDSIFYNPVFNQTPGQRQFSVNNTCGSSYMVSHRDSSISDDCSQGKISRLWTFTNRCGKTFQTRQLLIIKSRSDFEVVFPADIVLDCTMSNQFDPNDLPFPLIKDAETEDMEILYQDSLIQDTSSSCKVLLRKWELFDRCVAKSPSPVRPDIILNDSLVADRLERYCVYRALKDNGDGYMQYHQLIRFVDLTPPVIHLRDTMLEATNDCKAKSFTIFPDWSDNCSPRESILIEASLKQATGDDRQLMVNPGIIIPEGLNAGEYILNVRGRDLCGNSDTVTSKIVILDGSAPQVFCGNSTIPLTLPASGQMNIYARDFDAGSLAGCSGGSLRFSFSQDPVDSIRTLTCDSIGVRSYTLWISNKNNKQSPCQVVLQVNSQPNVCFPSNEFQIGGTITTGQQKGILQVNVKLEPTMLSVVTDANGHYQSPVLKGGLDYTIRPQKQDVPTNGISSIDLLVMEKHILGQAVLTDPYLLIAGDINQSGSITVSDLIELRRLILGNITVFSKNESWNFIPANYTFPDPSNPWIYPRVIEVKNLNQPFPDLNFIGIKTGDVNYSATVNAKGLESRNNDIIDLNIILEISPEGQQLKIYTPMPVAGITAMQMGFSIDGYADELKYAGGQLKLEKEEVNVQMGHRCVMAWVDPNGKDLNTTEPILIFDLIGSSKPVRPHLLTSDLFSSFLYFNRKEYSINWQQKNDKINPSKIYPNPSKEEVNIDFFVEKTAPVLIFIQTLSGKKVYIKNPNPKQGWNHILLNKSDLGGAGLYYFIQYLGHSYEKTPFIIF